MTNDWQDNPNHEDEEIIYVSKSELKRDAQDLQKLADKMLSLSPANLKKLPLNQDLTEAVKVAEKIRDKKGAYNRQLAYIAKLLRFGDPEPIKIAIAKIENQHLLANQHFHQLEDMRDQVITQGDSKINQLVEEFPLLERAKLRQLARQAKKEAEQNKPPKSARQLYQYLKDNIPHKL
ncbi:ribosome-associated protein [Catenovulum sp. 2E275]|uniref:ribosome biogenesis factor YjgA n=1 Tax=Catenovulum sp. 2E275 TaxID=2980497 RepID=UPI0021D04119|nr:ribosome biogenesis factor YjgA [Catenovulum sp. 2E275]MCU4675450.1 ribosome-associated protein [Catenovulum sp. 2E275]